MTSVASAIKLLGWILGVLLLVTWGTHLKIIDFWSGVPEFPIKCDGPELLPNRSTVKVVVAGFAKSGTRTIARALNEIGIRAYHSEDLYMWSYREYASAWYKLDKTMTPQGLVQRFYDDPRALTFYASALSRCQVEAVVLDGMEHTTFPTLESNPDAKVIKLDWRDYQDYKKSFDTFMPKLMFMVWHNVVVGSSLYAPIPWGALLKLIDPWTGQPIEKALRTGGPPICEVSGPMTWMYHQNLNWKNQIRHWMWTGIAPQNESEYFGFFQTVSDTVSKANQLSFNPKKSTYEDLCSFLEISPCPRSGKFARSVNTFIFERDFRYASFLTEVVRLFIHWVNWRLCCDLVSASVRLLRKCSGKESPQHGKLD